MREEPGLKGAVRDRLIKLVLRDQGRQAEKPLRLEDVPQQHVLALVEEAQELALVDVPVARPAVGVLRVP